MNIREIAELAKVSGATVSRTINCVPTVKANLAKRVWKIISERGYYPNTQARALVSGRTRIFGLAVWHITNPFFPEIVRRAVCDNADLHVIGEASDGAEAATKARDLKPDLVLLDVGLPSLNGIEVARQIRQSSPQCNNRFLDRAAIERCH